MSSSFLDKERFGCESSKPLVTDGFGLISLSWQHLADSAAELLVSNMSKQTTSADPRTRQRQQMLAGTQPPLTSWGAQARTRPAPLLRKPNQTLKIVEWSVTQENRKPEQKRCHVCDWGGTLQMLLESRDRKPGGGSRYRSCSPSHVATPAVLQRMQTVTYWCMYTAKLRETECNKWIETN